MKTTRALAAIGRVGRVGWAGWVGLVVASGLALGVGSLQPAATPPSAVAAKADRIEHWYEVSLEGKHAGHQLEEVVTQDGKTTTRLEVLLVMKRGTTELRNTIESKVVENEKNEVLTMWAKSSFGGDPLEAEYTFEADGVKVKRTQHGSVRTTRENLPTGAWLSPSAAQKFIAQRQTAGAKEFAVRTIDPAAGLEASTDTYTLQESQTLTVQGKPLKTWKYKVKSSRIASEQTVWLDEHGETVRTEADMGATKLVMMASTKQEAMRRTESTEIMVAASVKPKGDAARASRAGEAEYLLSMPDGELPDLPGTASQTVARRDKASSVVTVEARGEIPAPAAEAQDSAYLKASSWVDRDDAEIRGLTDRALKGVKDDALAKAEAIRSFVRTYITKKDFGSGFATASQVARSKAGDCTEHAVLCAAMLRAAEIPSRVASGLVYAEEFGKERNVFAYHMWTQALIEVDGKPRWVELDATLPGEAFNAGHLALVVTSLKDGEFETSMAPIARMLGKLNVEVVSAK